MEYPGSRTGWPNAAQLFCLSSQFEKATTDSTLSDPWSGVSAVDDIGMDFCGCGELVLVSPPTTKPHMSKTKGEMSMMTPVTITGGRQLARNGFGANRVVRRGWLLDWRREAYQRRHKKQQESNLHLLLRTKVDSDE